MFSGSVSLLPGEEAEQRRRNKLGVLRATSCLYTARRAHGLLSPATAAWGKQADHVCANLLCLLRPRFVMNLLKIIFKIKFIYVLEKLYICREIEWKVQRLAMGPLPGAWRVSTDSTWQQNIGVSAAEATWSRRYPRPSRTL